MESQDRRERQHVEQRAWLTGNDAVCLEYDEWQERERRTAHDTQHDSQTIDTSQFVRLPGLARARSG